MDIETMLLLQTFIRNCYVEGWNARKREFPDDVEDGFQYHWELSNAGRRYAELERRINERRK